MKVLVVDDEPGVLEGIERSLFHLDWEIFTAESGSAALDILADEPVDVVISDMRMPGMDGAELLRLVKERYPKTLRVVLSGHTEATAAMRAVPVAHQFLAKPCGADTIETVVNQALALTKYLQSEDLRIIVGEISELPSVPSVYSELTAVISQPESSVLDVAAVVRRDMAMTAKVLQIVNSSFFTQGRVINSIEEAVVRLGMDRMKSLALATHAFSCAGTEDLATRQFLEKEQRHALTIAHAAAKLVDEKSTAEVTFLAGILHDVGKVVLRLNAPKLAAEIQAVQDKDGLSLHTAEERVLGVTHAEIGAYLVGIWGLSYPVVEAVAHHHHPERVRPLGGLDVLAALHIANNVQGGFAHCMQYLEQAGVAEQLASLEQRASSVQSS